jgi:hypothetical protein
MRPEDRLLKAIFGASAGMRKIKIQHGTPKHGETLCSTCRNAVILKGMAESEELTTCNRLNGWNSERVPFPVSQCSEYDDKRHPSKYDMEKIAWVLVTKKAGREVGFVSAKEYKAKVEREEENE